MGGIGKIESRKTVLFQQKLNPPTEVFFVFNDADKGLSVMHGPTTPKGWIVQYIMFDGPGRFRGEGFPRAREPVPVER